MIDVQSLEGRIANDLGISEKEVGKILDVTMSDSSRVSVMNGKANYENALTGVKEWNPEVKDEMELMHAMTELNNGFDRLLTLIETDVEAFDLLEEIIFYKGTQLKSIMNRIKYKQ